MLPAGLYFAERHQLVTKALFDRAFSIISFRSPKAIPDSKLPPAHTGAAFGVQAFTELLHYSVRTFSLLLLGASLFKPFLSPFSVFCYTHQFASARGSSNHQPNNNTDARSSDAGVAQHGNLPLHAH